MTRAALSVVCGAVLVVGGSSTGRISEIEAGSVAPKSRTLELLMNTCDAKHTIEVVEEGPATVVITIESSRGSDDDCGDVVLVELSQPLGDRVVIDGHTDEPIPIEPVE